MIRLASFCLAACLLLLAAPAMAQSPTRTRLITSPNPSQRNQVVKLTAEVDGLGGGRPTGAVIFADGATELGSATVHAVGAGQATVTAGALHTCALTSAGGVKCWGDNRLTPFGVAGLSSGVVAVAAGAFHTCALTSAGGVKCWGYNSEGQLGDGTRTGSATPEMVVGLSSGVIAITAGEYHTCAVTGAGAAKCWGYNISGQLGTGTSDRSTTPVSVVGLSSGVVAITAGERHTCALTSAGGVKCWGSNTDGRLGDGTGKIHRTPVAVSGLSSGVVAVAAGGKHSCAVTIADGVKCWGDNSHGQLGDGTTTDRPTPVAASGLASGVVTMAAGRNYNCALTGVGGVKCWGRNVKGQLGDGTRIQRLTPVDVSGLPSGVVALATGHNHTCAVNTAGGAKCWGDNDYGQLGDGTGRFIPLPKPVGIERTNVVSARGLHTCAVLSAGGVKCWGLNVDGALGDGTTITRFTPVAVSGLSSGVVAVAVSNSWLDLHSCALTGAGGLKCWGSNYHGELGDGTTIGRLTPVAVSGLSSGVVAVSAGYFHTCAVTSAGGVKCWGDNSSGQLGDGTTTERLTPVAVSGLSSGVVAVNAGYFHTCAVTSAGGVKCWGRNNNGQLGNGTQADRLTPVDVAGLASGAVAVSAGGDHSCAVTSVGAVKCWGFNGSGALGDGTSTDRLAPVAVSGLSSGVVAVTAGGFSAEAHSCAVTSAGGAKCWGSNHLGQLGDGTTIHRLTPVDVAGLSSGFIAVTAGYRSTCALTSAGVVKCWGDNDFGQLGLGRTAFRVLPTPTINFAGLVRARARMSTGVLGVGTHTLDAAYPGDAAHSGSSGSITHRVDP